MSNEGVVKVHKITAATDCGHAVNPQQIEAQVEGSFAYGLSAALFAAPNPTVIKGVLHAEGRIPTADVRLPLLPADPALVATARALLGS